MDRRVSGDLDLSGKPRVDVMRAGETRPERFVRRRLMLAICPFGETTSTGQPRFDPYDGLPSPSLKKRSHVRWTSKSVALRKGLTYDGLPSPSPKERSHVRWTSKSVAEGKVSRTMDFQVRRPRKGLTYDGLPSPSPKERSHVRWTSKSVAQGKVSRTMDFQVRRRRKGRDDRRTWKSIVRLG